MKINRIKITNCLLQKNNGKFRSKVLFEFIVVIVLFIIGMITAMSWLNAFRDAGNKFFFYQRSYEPAVMLACGKGFGVGAISPGSALQEFLSIEWPASSHNSREELSCEDLPLEPVLVKEFRQGTWYYLLLVTGLFWKITGVSWFAFDYLIAIFFASSVSLVYGVLRTGIGRPISFLLSLSFCFSATQLGYLSYFRDYCKVPFFLSVFLIIAILIRYKLSNRLTLLLVICLGLVTGVGYGFRTDLLIVIPVISLVLLFLLPRDVMGSIKKRLFLLVTMLLSFIISAFPVFKSALGNGSGTFHFALLGFGPSFTRDLHLKSSLYELIHQFNDSLVYAMVQNHGFNFLKINNISYCDHSYDIASASLYKNILINFPADILIRCFSAFISCLNSGFVNGNPPAHYFDYDYIKHLFFRFDLGLGLPVATAALVLFLLCLNLRYGISLLIMILYFGAYTSIQFNQRHTLHLEVIPLFVIGLIVQFFFVTAPHYLYYNRLSSLVNLYKKISNFEIINNVFKGVSVAFFFVSFVFLSLSTCRYYQSTRLEKIIETYLDSETSPIVFTTTNLSETEVGLEFDLSDHLALRKDPNDFTGSLIRVEMTTEPIQIPIELKIGYETLNPGFDFAQRVMIPKGFRPQNTILFFPIYYSKNTKPTSLQITKGCEGFIKSIELVSGLKDFPLWITFFLPEDWRAMEKYQKINFRNDKMDEVVQIN